MSLALFLGTVTLINVSLSPSTDKIVLHETETDIYIDQNYTIFATMQPFNGVDNYITWSISDETIAKITKTDSIADCATITPVSYGTAIVTATTQNNLSATCTINVIPRHVTSIELTTSHTLLLVGETASITSTIKPTDATLKDLTWTSSNPEVLTVVDGVVTAISDGEATVTAQAVSEVSQSITFQVRSTIPVETIKITSTSTSLDIRRSYTLQYSVEPSNATYSITSWTSSKPDIISVDQSGRVTTKAVGSAVITATTNNGKTATIYLNVPRVAATDIRFGMEVSKKRFKVGDVYQIDYYCNPQNATDTIVWTSSNPDLVSIDQTGKITILQEFQLSVMITATVNGHTATAHIFYDTQI